MPETEWSKKNMELISPITIGNLANSIKGSDPLGVDGFMHTLGILNSDARVDEIIEQGRDFIPTQEKIEAWAIPEAHAALRDLGIITASIAYHGRDPLLEMPGVEEALMNLGAKAEVVPRDNLFLYCIANPEDDTRRRSYSGTQTEVFLIEAVRVLGQNMTDAVYGLESIYHDTEGDHGPLLEQLEAGFANILSEIVQAKQNIPTAAFRKDIGNYFVPLSIGGTQYEPPSAAHTNLLVMDYIMWGSDCPDENYGEYVREYSKYLAKHDRQFIGTIQSRESLLSRLEREAGSGVDRSALISSISKMLNRIYSFRNVHFTMATGKSVAISNREATPTSKHLNPNDSLHNVVIQTMAARERMTALLPK